MRQSSPDEDRAAMSRPIERVPTGTDDELETLRGIGRRLDGYLYRCRNDAQFTCLYMSESVRNLIDYPAEDFIGNLRRTIPGVTPPEDVQRITPEVEKALAERRGWQIYYRVNHRDGRELWVRESGSGVFDDHGNLLYLEGFAFNVDAHHRAEERERERLQALSQVAGGILSETEQIMQGLRTLRVLAVNARVEASRAGDQGRGFATIARQVGELAEQSAEQTTRIGNRIAEVRGLLRDGTPSSRQFAPVHAKNATVPRPMYSERVDAGGNDELETLRGIGRRIDGYLYRCRNDEHLTCLYMSESVQNLTGYPAADFLGNVRRSIMSLTPQEDVERLSLEAEKALAERRGWQVCYRVIHRDGRELWVQESAAGVFDEHGTLQFLEGFVFNIDARYRAEQRERERLQKLTQAAADIMSETELIMQGLRNLRVLAVNARVEANRAGDKGRAFAVIAGQVGELADQSAEQTKCIGSHISVVRGLMRDGATPAS
jgi:PAS domain S-box-containing protein